MSYSEFLWKCVPLFSNFALEYAIIVIHGTQELELNGTCQLLFILVMLLQEQHSIREHRNPARF
jgi:hypothetical protein